MSEKITVYEKPTCTTCRKLNKLFERNGIDYTKVNYFIEPFTEENLSEGEFGRERDFKAKKLF